MPSVLLAIALILAFEYAALRWGVDTRDSYRRVRGRSITVVDRLTG